MNVRKQMIFLPARLAVFLIRAYQWGVSPIKYAICGPTCGCRFHPTCSEYACTAIQEHGFLRGFSLALGRILRCHPRNVGGFDPVPLSPTQRSLDRPLESKADGAISRKSDDIGDVDLKAFPIRDISTHFEN